MGKRKSISFLRIFLIFYQYTSAPKGIKASFASLNCCNPKGIPMMVMQSPAPKARCSRASGRPETISHIIFRSNEPAPPPYCTSFPKGKKLNVANLKHCNPTGIPTIVMHHKHPASTQLSPLTAPPNTNHNKFPRQPMSC